MSTVKVGVTGAAGQIGYSILPMIASGQLLGPNQLIDLALLANNMLKGEALANFVKRSVELL